ncbi:probable kinetochore protein NUF2 [Ananas comosus]|uniref:Probable kinetochore protein NUF2 n=1 Tax=Ananas comosus TaxID=4615 RepID=A0A6P5G5M4_ANACO|nr:probable kinetochore protein NUF2 [Ananas comosus]
MSSFSVPEVSASEIASVLASEGIVSPSLKPDDLASPSPDLLLSIFFNFFACIDPLSDGADDQIGFAALKHLDNPDHHADSIRILSLYRKAKDFLASIRFPELTLRDLLKPDPRRASQILSALVNFLYYREDKLAMLKPIVNEFPNSEEWQAELKEKIAELKKRIMEHEVSAQMEEPLVQQVEAEVKELRQTIQNYNKQQMSLKARAKELKEKTDAVNNKISQADFELVKNAQENSKLLSKIVQSPDKLQRALEEKKTTRTEAKNSEKLAMQSVQEKTATLEMYSKAYDKMSKHLSKMQAIQEQVVSAKTVEKEVKGLKAKLSDESVSIMALEAKLVEQQGKAKEAEELLKATEKDKELRLSEEAQKLNTLRAEMEWKLQCLEPRERKVEAMVAKGDSFCSEADTVREAGRAKQQELQAKMEEIVNSFHNYSNVVSPFLQRLEEVEGETLRSGGPTS